GAHQAQVRGPRPRALVHARRPPQRPPRRVRGPRPQPPARGPLRQRHRAARGVAARRRRARPGRPPPPPPRPEPRFAGATEMLEEWWRVAAALDRDAPPPEVDVVFDEDEWVNTMVESLSRSASNAIASGSTSGSNPLVRTLDDPEAATDPELQRPTENTLRAAREVDPPVES